MGFSNKWYDFGGELFGGVVSGRIHAVQENAGLNSFILKLVSKLVGLVCISVGTR